MQELINACLQYLPSNRPSAQQAVNHLCSVDFIGLRKVIPVHKDNEIETCTTRVCPLCWCITILLCLSPACCVYHQLVVSVTILLCLSVMFVNFFNPINSPDCSISCLQVFKSDDVNRVEVWVASHLDQGTMVNTYSTHLMYTECTDTLYTGCTDTLYTGCTDTLYTGCTDTLYTGCTDTSYTGCTDTLYTGCTDTLYTRCTVASYTGCTDPSCTLICLYMQ